MSLDFVFKSSDHIRFENAIHVSGTHGGAGEGHFRVGINSVPNKTSVNKEFSIIYLVCLHLLSLIIHTLTLNLEWTSVALDFFELSHKDF
jgi:hypothetical protein